MLGSRLGGPLGGHLGFNMPIFVWYINLNYRNELPIHDNMTVDNSYIYVGYLVNDKRNAIYPVVNPICYMLQCKKYTILHGNGV